MVQLAADPTAAHQLNARPTALTIPQLEAYIDRFDGISSHLIGIFEKTAGRLVGIRSIYVDYAKKEFLDNILIGEPDARHKTARSESTDAISPIFFEELGMLASRCAILAENTHMLELVVRKGWVLEGTESKSASTGGPPRTLHHFRLSRDVWRQKRAERQR
jgi:hypothetical protein